MIEHSKNVSDASFSLIICGQDLPFEEIGKKTGLEPTKMLKKGQLITRLPEIMAQEDAWYHTIQLSCPDDRDPAMLGMLASIYEAQDYINGLVENNCRVQLRLSVNSDKAIMGYRLTPSTIDALQRVGMPLDVDSVSWGEAGF